MLKHAAATRIVMQGRWHGDEAPPLCASCSPGGACPARRAGPMSETRAQAQRQGQRGHGISNMRARAQAIGARLEIAAGRRRKDRRRHARARSNGRLRHALKRAPAPGSAATRRQAPPRPAPAAPRPAMNTISPQASSRAPERREAHRDEGQQRAGQEDQRVDRKQPVDHQTAGRRAARGARWTSRSCTRRSSWPRWAGCGPRDRRR